MQILLAKKGDYAELDWSNARFSYANNYLLNKHEDINKPIIV